MPTGLTQLIVANRALTEVSRGNPLLSGDVSSDFDGSADGIYVATLYRGAVEMLLRNQDWEFARHEVALTPTSPAPLLYPYAYLYPDDCLRIRQVLPQTWDQNDPVATRWDVGSTEIASVPTRVIATTVPNAQLIYTTNDVTEAEWDSIFAETVVRYLGSILALPVAGRPDYATAMLRIAGQMGSGGEAKDS